MSYIHGLLPGAAIIILATLVALRRAHIRVEYSVSWLGLGLILFVCGLFPDFLAVVAVRIGLNPGTGFVVLAGTLTLALLFDLSHVVSQLRDENVQLAQRLAIVEFQVRQGQAEDGVRVR